MTKAKLNLSIDTDLLEMAKQSNLNLSSEFEEWVRIRLNQNIEPFDTKPNINIDKEILRLNNEMKRLRSQRELEATQEMKDKELNMLLDHIIDNCNSYLKPSEKIEESILKRINGFRYLYKNKYKKELTEPQATKMILNRIRERGL